MKKFFIGGALLLFILGSCNSHAGHNHDHEAEGHDHEAEAPHGHDEHEHGNEPAGHSDEISLPAAKAKAAGVVAETVNPASFRQVIPVSGQILAAQGDDATVVATASGVVSFARKLTEGMQVGKGTALVYLTGEHLQEGDPARKAEIAYRAAKEEYERAAKLVDRQIVSQKEFNAIREAYENARIAYEALTPGGAGKGTAVTAPMGGYLKNCLVKEGDYVSVGQPLMSITQNRRLQLKAEVSERYYSALKQVTSANFKTPYDNRVYELEQLKGRLLSYGKTSGDTSFYLPVVFEFDNCGDMVPGSFVEVYLLGTPRTGVISLPWSAITEEQGLNFVYLQLDADCYRKQEVKLGASDGSRVEILSGLKGGEKVVTQGAVHVKLASASNAIPAHTHQH